MGRDRASRPATAAPQASAAAPDSVANPDSAQRPADITHAIGNDQGPVDLRPAGIPAPIRDDAVVRAQIKDNSNGTYILDILQQQQQLLMRWPDRRADGLRVWIERETTLPDWNSSYASMAEHAFDEWHEAGFPV